MNADDLSLLYKILLLTLVDLGLGVFVLKHIPRVRFGPLKLALVAAAALFWGIFATILRWSFWESYYRYFAPDWTLWAAPLAALFYAAVALVLAWLAARLPGNPGLNFCLLGGLESVPEHLWGIYGAGILRVPILQGINPSLLLVFAFFEYVLYWSVVLVIAHWLRWIWDSRAKVSKAV